MTPTAFGIEISVMSRLALEVTTHENGRNKSCATTAL